METYLALIPGLLLLGAVLNGTIALLGARGAKLSNTLVTGLALAAPGLAFLCAFHVFAHTHEFPGITVENTLWSWFSGGSFAVDMKLTADALTCVMLLVITGIGTLIHVYSTGYMKGDCGYPRYFACLNLFTFFMTILVLAGNLPVLFVGWEGVGLCSYLLIGYWFTDEAKAKAGMKAFVVNRIGDAGFILGALLLWNTLGTLDFQAIRALLEDPANRDLLLEPSGFLGASIVTIVTCLLFWGATGKSAQIPLYVWLPDAMAGPTPVSALIHAATMVTAGVYMIARLNFLFAMSPFTQGLILIVASITSLLAGFMALTQFDIKKVLAYSTISQIGYMMIGVATGNIAAGMFHVVTHAFFKASLFLGSGTVIAMNHHEQDMRQYGGLARKMPWTCAAMTLSAAAMAGIPPLSGFFSKDEVLWQAFSLNTVPGKIAWGLGMIGALCTAFYMFRLIFMTFGGSYRGHHHPHEAPRSMTVPQGILALGAALVGFLAVPHILGGHNAFGHYLETIIPEWSKSRHAAHGPAELVVEWALMTWSVLIGIAGIFGAWWCYMRRPELPKQVVERIPRIHRLVDDRFKVDEFYADNIVDPVEKLGKTVVVDRVDRGLIDGIIHGLAFCFRGLADVLRKVQTGVVRNYVAVMVVGLLLLVLSLLAGRS